MPAEAASLHGTEAFAALSEEARGKLAAVKLLILDVDGVLTDGGLYYDAEGKVSKRFNVHDGLGIGLARRSGMHVAVITGQDSPAVAARIRALGIEDYFPGFIDKRESYGKVRQKYGLSREEVAYLGDDWVDLPVMHAVGAPLAVANAQPEVMAAALYVTRAHGGHGAVREAIRLLFHCKGQLEAVYAAWMEKHRS